ncbi:MAG: alkaline phosphatase family protein [Sulfuricella sp.]|nr:alkaline phosphatase family protein [Sulfuricella sp.]
MVLPDYQGVSILNLMASIESACGGNPPYLPLRALPPDEIAGARNLILLIIDGLGHERLISGCAGGALHRHLRAKITSVFPSTTATAITTFLTGLAPQQHGLTGWFTYFREIGSVAAVLPFRPRHGGRSYREAGIEVNALMGHKPFFDKIAVPSYVVSPEWIVHSDFNAAHSGRAQRRGYDTLDTMFQSIAGIVRESPERKYVYAYYPGLDTLAHEYGIGSPRATTLLSRLDEAFERFLAEIGGSDSTVIVSADHGFIDASPGSQIELEDHPSLAETLLLPLCGEPRAAYCYVHPEKTEQFETYVRSELSAQAGLFKSRKLVEEGWFGPGEPHPRLLDRVGHYTLVMRENYAIKDWLIGESRYTHIGQHGGVSEAEMQVPLIVAQA